MRIEIIGLECFKGTKDMGYNLSQVVNSVCGKNGTGKTTLADFWFWLFSDKDYEMHSNPEVHPDDMEESEPSGYAICEINGKKVKFRKYQADLRTKKQKEMNAPVRISNKYEINDVPKTQKDFNEYLKDSGIDTDMFLMLCHPENLLSMTIADRRKVIFKLAGELTDKDVANQTEGCSKVAEMLDDYTLEEITAMSKVAVKRCKENLESIPNQIIGMEKSKVDVDNGIQTKKDAVEAEIEQLTADYQKAVKEADESSYDSAIAELRSKRDAIYNEANTDRLTKLAIAYDEKYRADDVLMDARRNMSQVITDGNMLNASYKKTSEVIKRLKTEKKMVTAEKWNGKTHCPTCGQPLPKDEVEKAKANWEEQHKARLEDIDAKLAVNEEKLEEYKTQGAKLKKDKTAAQKAVKDAEDAVNKCSANVTLLSEPVRPDYGEIETQIAEMEKQKIACDAKREEVETLGRKIKDRKIQLESIIKRMAAEVNNDFIDERIAELKEEQRNYAQTKADSEAILHQVQLISQHKNELLSDAVNSHFTCVKFRLFNTQKNGEIKDDCTPLVKCSDGEYRDMTYSANTAAIVMAKIDICVGLQKYFGQELPIWLDGAECLDEENRKALNTDRQLVLLCVTEDEGLVIK